MADDFLSQEEVDALLQGVDDEVELEVNTSAESSADSKNAVSPAAPSANGSSSTLASLESLARGRLPRLETMHHRFAALFQTGLKKLMGRNAEVVISPIKQSRYSDFIDGLTLPSNLNLVGIKPLQGTALFVLEPEFIFLVIDQLFGGQGRPHISTENREFTPTEHRIIQRILAELFTSYSKVWEKIYPIEVELIRSESHTRFVKIFNPEEMVLTTSMTVHSGAAKGKLHLCLPGSMIEPVRSLLNSEAEATQSIDKRWQQRMSRQLQSAEVELVARLSELNVTLGDLMKMQPGDFIPVEMPESILVHVDDVPIMNCSYGISNHQYALRVEKLLTLSSGSSS